MIGEVDGGIAPGIPDEIDRPESTEAPEQGASRVYGDPAEPGDLLTLKPKEAAKALVRMWTTQREKYARHEVEWEVNEKRRGGDCNVWATKTQDQQSWQVYKPPGSADVPPAVFNKSDRLCQRLCSQVYADPPVLKATPESGSSEDRDAADLSTRVLRDVDAESTLNDLEAHRAAFDVASSFGSGYIRYFADPKGGGRHPVTVEAGQGATTAEDATRDPMTGQPRPGPFVRRFVAPDGALTDDTKAAALRWHPKLCREVLPANHVRFWPETADDLWDAEIVLVAKYHTWGTLKGWYPELAETPPEVVERLTRSERPERTERLLPQLNGKPKDPKPERVDDRLVFTLLAYATECPSYPDGLEMLVLGESVVVFRRGWVMDGPNGREPMDIPLTQIKQFRGPRGNPHGIGLMHLLGPASEWRASLAGAMQDILDRILNRKVYVPTNSILQGKQAHLQYMTHIPINPGGEPKYEDVPTDALEPAGDLFAIATREMDDASSLQEAGQGLQDKSVQSGKHAATIISQVQAGLSDIRQNAARASERAGRVKLQLVRRYYTVPALLRYTGEDGEFKVRAWRGADLRSTKDVSLVPGSLSMLSPMQKAERAMMYGQAGLIPPDDLREMVLTSTGSEIGWQDNPHVLRVRQQVAKWEGGPGEDGVAEPVPLGGYAPAVMADPMTGAPVPIPGAPPVPQGPMVDPRAMAIFDPRPVDAQPDVAVLRVRELGRAMAGHKYGQFPAEWRAALDMAYQAAVQAVTPQPAVPADPQNAAPPDGAPADPNAAPNLSIAA